MDDGRLLGRERPHGTGDPDALRELWPVQEAVPVAEAERLVLPERGLQRRDALRPARQDQLAALVEAGVDPRLGADAPDLVHGVVRRLLGPRAASTPCIAPGGSSRCSGPGRTRRRSGRTPQSRRSPAPPRRSSATGPGAGRRARSRVRSCRRPGSPRRHPWCRRSRAGGQVVTGGLEPEGDGCVVAHGRIVRARGGAGRAVAGGATAANGAMPPPEVGLSRPPSPEVRPMSALRPPSPSCSARSGCPSPSEPSRTRTRRGPAR